MLIGSRETTTCVDSIPARCERTIWMFIIINEWIYSSVNQLLVSS